MSLTGVGGVGSPSESEQRVLEAVASRGVADFSQLPDEARLLRAPFLEALITGSVAELPPISFPLRIRGAKIVGPIRAVPNGREGGGITLLFWNCQFDSTVDFSGGQFLSLRFVDCTMPAFIGISLRIKADLDLSGSHFSGVHSHTSDLADVGHGAVHLNQAHIGGRLLLSATAQGRFESTGSVKMDGAHIDSSVAPVMWESSPTVASPGARRNTRRTRPLSRTISRSSAPR